MIGNMESLDELKEMLGSDYPWTLIECLFFKRTSSTISTTSIRII